jgi:hypothetical protein
MPANEALCQSGRRTQVIPSDLEGLIETSPFNDCDAADCSGRDFSIRDQWLKARSQPPTLCAPKLDHLQQAQIQLKRTQRRRWILPGGWRIESLLEVRIQRAAGMAC